MSKEPRAGQVKTRLTPPLTQQEAAALHRCFLCDTAGVISEAIRNMGGVQGMAVYTPAGSENTFKTILPHHFSLVLQRGETLGARLIAAAEDIFALGFASICLIGSDSPTVPANVYHQAVQWLADSEDTLVLGPSDDGGYYLIGLKRMHRHVFEEIDWGSVSVFDQTLERAKEIGVQVKLLPTWYDVDDHATLRRLCDELLADKAESHAATETKAFIQSLISNKRI